MLNACMFDTGTSDIHDSAGKVLVAEAKFKLWLVENISSKKCTQQM